MANTTIAHPTKPFKERFWSFVNKNTPSGCWKWTGTINTTGYGAVVNKGRRLRAHRAAWELTYGPIPKDLCVLHKCDNPPCCNPEHLFLGTHQDNMDDMARKGRAHTSGSYQKGERHPSAKLTEQDVLNIRASREAGVGQREIAIRYRVSRGLVSLIVSRQLWQHI